MGPHERESPQAAPRPVWEPLGRLEEFPVGGLRLVRANGHHLVVARPDAERVHVLDDRCPHEGYPLSQGALDDCALTCQWHNWKFDVRDGACLLGGEDVRAYPTRVRAEVLEVDLAEPDPARVVAGARASLERGLFEHDLGRALRDGVRLLKAGYAPWQVLVDAARYDARRQEYGTSHVLAVAADCARLIEGRSPRESMDALAVALDLCADANQRRPERALPAPVSGGDAASLRAAVEAEDALRAEGLVRGALRDGRGRATVERWLYAAMSDHFTDFGHQLIYLVKAQELFARGAASPEVLADVYGALTYSLVLATREDTLPYMRTYTAFLDGVREELPAVHARAQAERAFDPTPLRDAVLDGRANEALERLWSALAAGVPASRVALALVAAGAHRLYRYDERLERDAGVAENFLWATHRFTFASAVRNAVTRFDAPDALRLLFQSLAFTHSGRAMDAPPERRTPSHFEDAEVQGVLAAIHAKEPEHAVARAITVLRAGAADELRLALEAFCLQDPVVRPIAIAHVLKTTVAAFEEHTALAESPDREVPVLAAVRTWSLPLVERRVHAQARSSLAWVLDGAMPRKLTQ